MGLETMDRDAFFCYFEKLTHPYLTQCINEIILLVTQDFERLRALPARTDQETLIPAPVLTAATGLPRS